MAHPICGKCHSAGVYLDYELGQRVLVCPICGNRYPGGREGFYMSNKGKLNDLHAAIGGANTMEQKETENPVSRLCSTCEKKKTISPSHDICGSCLAVKGIEKRRLSLKNAPQSMRAGKIRDDKDRREKSSPLTDMAVNIDFSKHPLIYKQISDLAEQEIRPLDLQIIYLLKHNFEPVKASLEADRADRLKRFL